MDTRVFFSAEAYSLFAQLQLRLVYALLFRLLFLLYRLRQIRLLLTYVSYNSCTLAETKAHNLRVIKTDAKMVNQHSLRVFLKMASRCMYVQYAMCYRAKGEIVIIHFLVVPTLCIIYSDFTLYHMNKNTTSEFVVKILMAKRKETPGFFHPRCRRDVYTRNTN